MFRHILVATDGSALSARAVKAGLALAHKTGARVTGYHAVEPAAAVGYGEGFLVGRGILRKLERDQQDAARKHLAPMERAARKAGVDFQLLVDTPRSPYEGIVEAAKRRGCDAIVMASHGRGGAAALLLGSVTHQVLAHTRIPVVVYR